MRVVTADLVRVRVQLPFSSADGFAKWGHGWADLFIREGTSDEDVLREVWIEDAYRVRGIDLTPRVTESHATSAHASMTRTKTEGVTVIDVGACTGIFSALCLAFGASHVIAVEPEPDNCTLLRKNLAQYGDRATIIEGAVSGDGEPVHLYGDAGTGHTSPLALITTIGEPHPEMVPSRTLAQIIDLARSPIALLKMDIESAEYEATLACDHDHLAKVERIAMETHGPEMCPWAQQKIGALVEHLAFTHSVTVFGVPSRGGMLFAHRLDL